MNKYNIGQILTHKEDIELEGMLGTKRLVKADTKLYIGADGFAHYLDGTVQVLSETEIPEGYAVNGIADWLYMWLSNRLPIDDFLDDYDITKEEFKENIADGLEELGMWDNTGNRS